MITLTGELGKVVYTTLGVKPSRAYGRGQAWLYIPDSSYEDYAQVLTAFKANFETWEMVRTGTAYITDPELLERVRRIRHPGNYIVDYVFFVYSKSGRYLGSAHLGSSNQERWREPHNIVIHYSELPKEAIQAANRYWPDLVSYREIGEGSDGD